MRHVYLLSALLLLVPSVSLAQGQRLPFKDGEFTKDGSNDLVCEVDSSAADGIEFKLTRQGDLYAARSVGIGATTSASASCITRDAATDRIYSDKNCNQVKDAGEEYLDEISGGSGAPISAEYIVSELHGTLTNEVAPGAANQVPVSSSTTAAAWGTIPAPAIQSNAVTEPKLDVIDSPANGEVLGYQASTARLEWLPPDSSVYAPFSPPLIPTDHISGIAAFPMLKAMGTDLLFDRHEWNTVIQRVNAYRSIVSSDWASAKSNCESGATLGTNYIITDGNNACTGSGSFATGCECALSGTEDIALRPLDASHAYWTETWVGSPESGGLYFHPVIDWQDPWLTFGAPNQGDCISTVEILDNGVSGTIDVNPGTSILALMNLALSDNFTPPGAVNESEIQSTVAYIGWVEADSLSAGYESFINATGTTASDSLVGAEIKNGFGVLWFRGKFYHVWTRNNVSTLAVLFDLTDDYRNNGVYGFQQQRNILNSMLYNSWLSIQDHPYMKAAYATGLAPASGQFSWTASAAGATTGAAETATHLSRVIAVCNQDSYTVATLPPCTAGYNGVVLNVTDSTSGCSSGGGSANVTCTCNGTTWNATGSPPRAEIFTARHSIISGYIGN